jgi:glyoxylase-like metal-dependent hydrolase (beta-lactamase superfamily II)
MQIFNVGSNSVNLFLIDSGTHRLLIDAGFPGKLNDLGREMRKTGFKIRDIDYLIVTHFHIDHAGAVQELKEQNVKFVLFDIQIPFIAPMEKMALAKWNYHQLQMCDNRIMKIDESGDFLENLGLQGRILATPGHTDDSITLLLNSGEAFIGDLMPDFLVADQSSTAYQSWTDLKNANAKRIYPGHGKVYEIK